MEIFKQIAAPLPTKPLPADRTASFLYSIGVLHDMMAVGIIGGLQSVGSRRSANRTSLASVAFCVGMRESCSEASDDVA